MLLFLMSVTDLRETSCEQSKGLALGEQAKTTECCFCDAKSTKQGAIGEIYDFDAWRLCDLTGGLAEDVAGSNPVIPTISSVHNRFKLWTLDIFLLMLTFRLNIELF